VSRLLPFVAACVSAALFGCTPAMESVRLSEGPEPVDLRMRPGVLQPGLPAEIVVESPGADSIAVESGNGMDRIWGAGPVLKASLTADFGDTTRTTPDAVRWNGHLLDRLQKPARISACRQGHCREFYHEFPLRLVEHNRRTVALTAGWSTVFAQRTITGTDRSVLFEKALSNSVWSFQAELAERSWSALAQGFLGPDERGTSLDLSRVIKPAGDGLRYGFAMHLGLTQPTWLPEQQNPLLTDRTVYQLSVGPSIMIKGLTASTQVGVHTDGVETLQVLSTRVTLNGNLTAVRSPITLAAEKTFSFGGGAIISRRRDALESLSGAVHLVDDFALKVGVTTHRIAWPNQHASDDLRGAETLITLGGQYSLTW
jgi:hypothetical protein